MRNVFTKKNSEKLLKLRLSFAFTFLQFEIGDFFLNVHANKKMNFNYCLQQCWTNIFILIKHNFICYIGN